jgi:spermidine synthase
METQDADMHERTLEFHRNGVQITQARYDLNNPEIPGSAYTRAMLAFALWQPVPNRIFNIGLGSGRLSMIMERLFTGAEIINVDNDPVVPFVAASFFDFDPGPHTYVIVGDGADTLEQTEERFDVILIDAFEQGSAPPTHLWSKQFFQLCKKKLIPGGVVCLNIMDSSMYAESIYETMQDVFRGAYRILIEGNHIFFGTDRVLTPDRLVRRAEALDRKGGIHDFVGLGRKILRL